MKKLEIINSLSLSTLTTSLFFMIRSDNVYRLPVNLNTDYHMRRLPFIDLIIASLLILVILTILRMRIYQKD